jgi:hypothetical protein
VKHASGAAALFENGRSTRSRVEARRSENLER